MGTAAVVAGIADAMLWWSRSSGSQAYTGGEGRVFCRGTPVVGTALRARGARAMPSHGRCRSSIATAAPLPSSSPVVTLMNPRTLSVPTWPAATNAIA
jgi:hypothetical protein